MNGKRQNTYKEQVKMVDPIPNGQTEEAERAAIVSENMHDDREREFVLLLLITA